MRGDSRHVPSRPDRVTGQAPDRVTSPAAARAPKTATGPHQGSRAASLAAPRRGGHPAASGGAADAERLGRLLAPVISAAGMDLESVRVVKAGRRRLLRVVVDADGGPSLDDIALLSRSLSKQLDNSEVMGDAAYTLEVSSPGVDRPLTEPRHWRRAAGRLVRAPLTKEPGQPCASAGPGSAAPGSVQGRVVTADEAGVTLDIDGQRRTFGYPELGPGQVQVEFSRPGGAVAAGDEDDKLGEGERDGH